MKSIYAKLFAVLLAALLNSSLLAHAHSLWLEDTPGHGLTMRFAEWPDEYEVSPGHLDEVDPPMAWQTTTNDESKLISLKKESDQIKLQDVSDKDAVQLEAGFQVMTPAMMHREGAPFSTNMPSRKPIFYARWQPPDGGAAKPNMNFDIVPTGNPGEYQVYFRGQPIAATEIAAHLPDGKEQKLVADAQGIIHFTATQPGLYMITASHHRETIAGFSNGVHYDQVSHNCSLTWRQP